MNLRSHEEFRASSRPDVYVAALTGWQLATLQLREGDTGTPDAVRRLVKEAVKLNRGMGDPTSL